MNEKLDVKRIVVFLAFAFGIAWATGLAVYLTGGLVDSPMLVPELNLSLAVVLLALPYMWAPALAHIFTRLLTREGWQGMFLRPNFRRGWPFWVAAWFLPAVMTVLGGIVFFAIFPRYFDPSLGAVVEMLAATEKQTGQAVTISPWMIVVLQLAFAIIIAPWINTLFAFGEEFGWRSYLIQKLMPLGGHKAVLLIGVIWGIWHWPVIAMGHNYGVFTLDYPGAPWSGMLMMVAFTTVLGIFLGWVALRGGSVWPAALGHGAVNAAAGLSIFFTRVDLEPDLLLGPMPVGIIAMIPFIAVAAWIVASRDRLAAAEAPATVPEVPEGVSR